MIETLLIVFWFIACVVVPYLFFLFARLKLFGFERTDPLFVSFFGNISLLGVLIVVIAHFFAYGFHL